MGYLDLQNTELNQSFLSKLKFVQQNCNCVIDCNQNGILEVVSVKEIRNGEEITCWFSDKYLKNLRSKTEKLIIKKY